MSQFIYKIHFPTQHTSKVYIGKTHDPKTRWTTHKRDSRNGCGCRIHVAMRLYGIENAIFEVIATCLEDTDECADFCEIAMIAQYTKIYLPLKEWIIPSLRPHGRILNHRYMFPLTLQQ